MNTKFIPQRFFWLILIALLVACGTLPTEPTISPTTTSAPTFTPIASTATALLTETPIPTSTPGEPFTLESLRMIYANHRDVFIENGNLYIRDGINKAVQLTRSGKDTDPILSDDGKKIVFYRGAAYDNVYSINADGTQEKPIIISKTLPVLGRGKCNLPDLSARDASVAFQYLSV